MGSTSSDVVGVSDDGLIVAGNDRGPFVWTDASGQGNPGQHPDTHTSSTFANRISPDGNVIVGWTSTPNGRQGFRWTQQDGYENLGEAAGSGPSMWDAHDASFDGSMVVGSGLDASSGEIEAYIWDEANGARSLRVLLSTMGVDVTGWEIWDAQAVSHDGTTIVGVGRNPDGDRETWIAVIPEPSASILIGGGLILLSYIRRTSAC